MRLAVIGTFAGRHENSFALMHRLFVDGTRKPDEAWLMCESLADVDVITAALHELIELDVLDRWPRSVNLRPCPTPTDDGRYVEIPYSRKINEALERTTADMIVYLDNNSMPAPFKYELMAAELEAHPEYGAVYCTQHRTGFRDEVCMADGVVHDAYCAVNYTQVMHRRSDDRWTLDMRHADPDLADGLFWRDLHRSLGDFYPVSCSEILDVHHMPSPKAAGV